MMIAPARRSRSTTMASRAAGGWPASTVEPPSVVMPASSNRSFSEIGMPEICEAAGRPALRSASRRPAAARAESACTRMKARAPSPAGFWMAASASSTSWLLLTEPAARRRDSSAIDDIPIALPLASGAWADALGQKENMPVAAARPADCCRKVRRCCCCCVMALSSGWMGGPRGSLHSGRGRCVAGCYNVRGRAARLFS